MSRIIERFLNDQVESYLNEKKLLQKLQSSFLKKSSFTCLIEFTDLYNLQLGQGHLFDMILLDIYNAF